MRTFSTLTVE